ncbi:solute carrier family 10 (sodium/bile acid cotransporter), member 7 [Desulfacinum hydrothermale DSM 13146]|uniref:Solute carrier family 10 (Sodium/bile acid cotransporter), member 7 n=1 Tax=Desulfacinum hydrothermale DSM 13146 TaxID=1121390 RepID=A0A1W1X8Z1_9BACT|nr:bile acid:sodium symporter [Desulfacinum hydrothermale]SMC20294.1 solute carrier family 10 (sodium/bile acid cotransporter), member 7 [Desulfacinum hydrothermale DSM 13146]
MRSFVKKYWFLTGLILASGVTLADGTGMVAQAGRWLQAHRGPDLVIFAIFFFSGTALQTEQVRSGLSDFRVTAAALAVIFLVSPLWARVLAELPLPPGLMIGLFLVAAMPSTLSSGVVMTGAAGGNMASALMITLLANFSAIFTVPVVLTLLVGDGAGTAGVLIDKQALMMKMAMLVALPLALGIGVRPTFQDFYKRWGIQPNVVNGCFILVIVWIAVSKSRPTIVGGLQLLPWVVALVVGFHAGLLSASAGLGRLLGLGRGRMESLLFMGSQKTLPLSVLIQTALFPQYGEALVFCVCHHVIHLIMDGYLVGRLQSGRTDEKE